MKSNNRKWWNPFGIFTPKRNNNVGPNIIPFSDNPLNLRQLITDYSENVHIDDINPPEIIRNMGSNGIIEDYHNEEYNWESINRCLYEREIWFPTPDYNQGSPNI